MCTINTMARQTFDKFVMDAVMTYEIDEFESRVVTIGLRLGHSKRSCNLRYGNTCTLFSHNFYCHRFVEFERECIHMLNELAYRSAISITCDMNDNRYQRIRFKNMYQRRVRWCQHCSYRVWPSRCNRLACKAKRKPTVSIQPFNFFLFDIPLAQDDKTFNVELATFTNMFLHKLTNAVEAVERPYRSLKGLCMKTINKFKLQQHYDGDTLATHLLRLIENQ